MREAHLGSQLPNRRFVVGERVRVHQHHRERAYPLVQQGLELGTERLHVQWTLHQHRLARHPGHDFESLRSSLGL